MKRKSRWIMRRPLSWAGIALVGVALAGCKGLQKESEKRARQDFQTVQEQFRPDGPTNALPPLTAESGPSNYLAFALLKSPRVAAAYYDWASSVERITLARSLPDPTLSFQSDIADVVMSVMPGIMQLFPGPGKLKARANLAAAQSRSRYYAFESAVLQTAFELKRAFFELHFLDERIRINEQNLALLNEMEQIARAQNETGKETLQDVLRAQIERDRVTVEIANLEDSRRPRLAAFKAALGLQTTDADPPIPAQWESVEPKLMNEEQWWEVTFASHPQLKELEAEVRASTADMAVAYKEKVPDFSLGVMADVKASPVMVRPLAGMTLPIWRDKIAAGIAEAKTRELAAQTRLTAAQIALTVAFAEKTFAYREITRNLTLLREQLIPKAHLSVEIARASYLSGTISFFNLIDAERQQLVFQLEEVDGRARREIVLAELSLLIAGVPPAGAPLLPVSPKISNR